MDKNLQSILTKLPKELEEAMRALPDSLLNQAEEFRFKSGQPVSILSNDQEYALSYIVNQDMLTSLLNRILHYSFYAYETELANGYITMEGGHRVGVCGRTVLEKGAVRLIKDISSLNIRFSREVIGASDACLPHLFREDGSLHNTLIVSPPKCGKTTLLRDLIRNLSTRGYRVGVCDERSELAGSYKGNTYYDLGPRTDILDGCPKEQGIIMLIRSMSPHVIATDEIGKSADVYAVEAAMCAGVSLITTIHGNSYEDLLNSAIGGLVQKGIFSCMVFLSNQPKTGSIREIIYARENQELYHKKIT
ncbi:stage III sporulation protein AA [Aminipila butyrica]|uniref:Stage III sporulation protein AA n=1 Tax=Aminipila butyrica TaxID=433296 RepID=A0A858BTU5_9FIRM|nr:stage III sporulation protein AA [Aminipila butyrica]QIB69441.1 stage III sporulation protein AA [Aminipila butyrica]